MMYNVVIFTNACKAAKVGKWWGKTAEEVEERVQMWMDDQLVYGRCVYYAYAIQGPEITDFASGHRSCADMWGLCFETYDHRVVTYPWDIPEAMKAIEQYPAI